LSADCSFYYFLFCPFFQLSQVQGLIRHFRPELEKRINEFQAKRTKTKGQQQQQHPWLQQLETAWTFETIANIWMIWNDLLLSLMTSTSRIH
jgi:hypothetical protein